MNATADRLEFAPPQTAGLPRALVLAVLAHALLVAALTWGVRWKREADSVTAQAELWAAIPLPAAPRLVEAAPPPPAAPAPAAPALPQTAPRLPDADIALERDQLRLKTEQQQAAAKLERDQREKRKQALEKQRELDEKVALETRRAQRENRRKEELKAQQEAKRKEELKALQEAKRKEELKALQEAKRTEEQLAEMEAQRKSNMQRIAGLAGATGAPEAAGKSAQSAGPSASYGSRVSAKVRPNIVFTEDIVGNPTAEVEVRASSDGSIISRKLIKSSGTKAWDDAVLKAIDKTEVLPRDADGRIPSILVISFRAKE